MYVCNNYFGFLFNQPSCPEIASGRITFGDFWCENISGLMSLTTNQQCQSTERRRVRCLYPTAMWMHLNCDWLDSVLPYDDS